MKFPFHAAALATSLLALALVASPASAHTEYSAAAPNDPFGQAGVAKDVSRTIAISTRTIRYSSLCLMTDD